MKFTSLINYLFSKNYISIDKESEDKKQTPSEFELSRQRGLPFNMSEFIRRPDLPVPVEVQDKILEFHLYPLSFLRWDIDCPIIISLRSAFRPVEHEIEKGRSGNSEHCFKGLGASDITSPQFKKMVKRLLDLEIYDRLILYPDNNFVHGDYSDVGDKYGLNYERQGISWVSKGRFIEAIDRL